MALCDKEFVFFIIVRCTGTARPAPTTSVRSSTAERALRTGTPNRVVGDLGGRAKSTGASVEGPRREARRLNRGPYNDGGAELKRLAYG